MPRRSQEAAEDCETRSQRSQDGRLRKLSMARCTQTIGISKEGFPIENPEVPEGEEEVAANAKEDDQVV